MTEKSAKHFMEESKKSFVSYTLSGKPYALIKRVNDEDAIFLKGHVSEFDRLEQIPRQTGKPEIEKEIFDTLSILPFKQVEELGFVARGQDEKILCLIVEEQECFEQQKLLELLPKENISLLDGGQFVPDDQEYSEQIKHIIDDEIGQGEGCNFVIPRRFHSKVADFSPEKALSIFRNLLESEYGVYWSYLYFTGDRYFIGATPERHISYHDQHVKMNPISGTFRKSENSEKTALQALYNFVGDQKEIFELLMVTDEELKMMAEICSGGGQVVGPLLKEMSRLVHTEYLLVGRSNRDIIDMLRESMFAATVIGSPVENACRIIYKYDQFSRGYYGSALALIGRDGEGHDTLDSPITIRMVEIKTDGSLVMGVGSTLVRDAVPEHEVAETYAKTEAVLSALSCQWKKGTDGKPVSKQPYNFGEKLQGEKIQEALSERNRRLSRFWIEKQESGIYAVPELENKKVVIIDNEDSFTKMLGYMIKALGMNPQIIKYDSYVHSQEKPDLFILGPGPGDPCNDKDPKILKVRKICSSILADSTPLLAVCLGHQILAQELGFPIEKKAVTFQGKQEFIDLWGQKEWVGFYNTFVGKFTHEHAEGLEISFDEESGDIHALRGENFAGVQFHPESILTNNGIRIMQDMMSFLGIGALK
ncbi:MAG: chorismate-binding protein [Alphaproteobacteria bacterium]|nr:chorismate-binding protein [Alphaproteobacteria bacterium]